MEESKSSIVYHLRESLKHCYDLPRISHITYEVKDDGREIVEVKFKNIDPIEIDVTHYHGIEMIMHIVLVIKTTYNGQEQKGA